MKRFILASASPTRKNFFLKFPYPIEIIPNDFEEDMGLKLSPEDLAMALSAGKARDVAKKQNNAVVLGIDTFMIDHDGQLMGKPHTKEKAKEMLQKLSNNTHKAISGFTIVDTDSGKEYSNISTARITLRKITDQEIEDYIASKEPLDKAGAYASLELGSMFIEKVEGDFYTLSGIPIAKISRILADFGISLLRKN